MQKVEEFRRKVVCSFRWAPEESDSWIAVRRLEGSLWKVDQELPRKDGKMRAPDEVIERKGKMTIQQRGKGNERSRITTAE